MTTEQEYAKMWKATKNTALESLFRLMGHTVSESMCVGIQLQKIKEHPEIKEKQKSVINYHLNNVLKTEAEVLNKVNYLFSSPSLKTYILACFDIACLSGFKAGYLLLNKEKQDEFKILNWEAQRNLIDAYKEIKGMKPNETL